MFCKKFRNKIKEIVKKLTNEILQFSEIALHVTTVINKFLSSDVLTIVSDFTPTNLDNLVLSKLREATNYAVNTLQIVHDFKHDDLQKWQHLKEYLLSLPEIQRNKMLNNIKSLIIKYLDDSKEKDKFYDTLAQGMFYINTTA